MRSGDATNLQRYYCTSRGKTPDCTKEASEGGVTVVSRLHQTEAGPM